MPWKGHVRKLMSKVKDNMHKYRRLLEWDDPGAGQGKTIHVYKRLLQNDRDVDHTPKRQRRRPHKKVIFQEIRRLRSYGKQWLLVHANLHTKEGVQTRARRALIRSQSAGLILDCDEEIVVPGLINKIKLGEQQ